MDSRPRIIALQECWLNREDLMKLKLANYRPVAASEGMKTRAGTIRRGSVIIVDTQIVVEPLPERSKKHIELIGVKVIGDSKSRLENPFELWSAYSGPNSQEATTFTSMLDDLVKNSKDRVLLVGDMNAHYNPPGTKLDPCRGILELLEYLEEEGEAQILNEFGTHTCMNNSGTLVSTIDLAVTFGEWERGFAHPIEIELTSTHFPLWVGICVEHVQKLIENVEDKKFDRSKASEQKIVERCKELNGDIEGYGAQDLARAIIDMYTPIQKPKTKKQSRKKKNYWNSDINALFLKKQAHYNQHGKDPKFTEISEELNQKISEAKNAKFREFASGLDHTNNNFNVFRAMKNIGVRQPSRVAQLAIRDKTGRVASDIQEKADILARRYQTPLGHHPKRSKARRDLLKERRVAMETAALQEEAVSQAERNHGNATSATLENAHVQFTASEARIAREQMANNKAPGYSRIRKDDLELGGHEMDKLMANLGNKVVEAKTWPKVFKTNDIAIPIPKNQEAVDLIEEDQTRPITLLETTDKWLQKMVYNRVQPHVKYHETQAGYCLSCDHHTTVVSDFVLNRTNKPYVLAVFTDISKAFDSIPLSELVDAIWNSDIPTPYKWLIVSFIEDREYRVEIRDVDGKVAASKWMKKIYGMPEGSILGPMIWNIFFDPLLCELENSKIPSEIFPTNTQVAESSRSRLGENELVNSKSGLGEVKSDLVITSEVTTPTSANAVAGTLAEESQEVESLNNAFADDLTLLAAAEDPELAERYLEKQLEIFRIFLETRGMEAASHKLKIMSLDPHRRDYKPKVRYKGILIAVVEEHVSLGVILDKDMSFVKHWEMVMKAITGRIKTMKALRAASWGPTQMTMKVLHHSYVESRIIYGILAWYIFLHPFYRNKLEILLLQSVRLVIGLPIQTWNVALRAEADLNSVLELAQKSAVGFYARVNPGDDSWMTLAKKRFRERLPIWTRLISGMPTTLPRGGPSSSWKSETEIVGVPFSIWGGTIQSTLPQKKVIIHPGTCVHSTTLVTQAEAVIEEAKYQRILYTDASVSILSDIPGLAAVGYIWYQQKRTSPRTTPASGVYLKRAFQKTQEGGLGESPNGLWDEISRGSALIGEGHSSYSAEAIALRLGLENEPPITARDKNFQSGAMDTPARTRIGVFTDSLSNLSTIRGGIAATKEQELLLLTLANYPKAITLYHVKAHHENVKNHQVDALCNIGVDNPMRQDRCDLRGTKTLAKIKIWMKNYLTKQRLAEPLINHEAKGKGSITQSWITKHVSVSGYMHLRPASYNLLPRREGILLAKARVNRWTNCKWFLRKIKAISCDSCKKSRSWTTTCTVCESCTACGRTDNTAHVLNECQLHERSRTALMRKLGYAVRVTDLLTSEDKPTLKALTHFLVKVDDTRAALCTLLCSQVASAAR